MSRKWIRFEVPCESAVVDDLSAELADAFGVGVEIDDAGVRFYLEGDRVPDEWRRTLEDLLSDFQKLHGLSSPIPYTHLPVLEEDWADRWKTHFKPLRIGKHFVVCPTWDKVKGGHNDLVIVMDPGRAFGTGYHESTRLCLEWLEGWASDDGNLRERSLLDVGTGSGILAIGAALLGCSNVLGIDVDPEAMEVAMENVELNALTRRVGLRTGRPEDVADSFDVVVANIQSSPLIAMAGLLIQRLKRPGKLVLSGILVEQKSDVRAAYESQGVNLVETRVAGEWCLLVFQSNGKA